MSISSIFMARPPDEVLFVFVTANYQISLRTNGRINNYVYLTDVFEQRDLVQFYTQVG
jgi:hypothetical protein